MRKVFTWTLGNAFQTEGAANALWGRSEPGEYKKLTWWPAWLKQGEQEDPWEIRPGWGVESTSWRTLKSIVKILAFTQNNIGNHWRALSSRDAFLTLATVLSTHIYSIKYWESILKSVEIMTLLFLIILSCFALYILKLFYLVRIYLKSL